MIEAHASGNWPANSVFDITIARDYFRNNGYEDADFTMISHYRVDRCFEFQIANTIYSYRDWLLHQGILHSIIIDNNLEDDVAYVYATRKKIPFIKIIDGLHMIPSDSIYKITNIVVT